MTQARGPQAPSDDSQDPGDVPRDWWNDFVMENWEWVAQKIGVSGLPNRIEGLRSALRGEVVGQIQRDFLRWAEPFELDDPVIQETVWADFFRALDEIWEFCDSVRTYHDLHYPSPSADQKTALAEDVG